MENGLATKDTKQEGSKNGTSHNCIYPAKPSRSVALPRTQPAKQLVVKSVIRVN
jgi:hypothetical protein